MVDMDKIAIINYWIFGKEKIFNLDDKKVIKLSKFYHRNYIKLKEAANFFIVKSSHLQIFKLLLRFLCDYFQNALTDAYDFIRSPFHCTC
jgi:hypothetical protein